MARNLTPHSWRHSMVKVTSSVFQNFGLKILLSNETKNIPIDNLTVAFLSIETSVRY